MVGFIIAIVIFVIGSFIYDSCKQYSTMRSEGGVKTKYAQLIELIMAEDVRIKIYQETNTFISLGVHSVGGARIFYIQQTFGNVNIQLKIKDNPILGNFKMEWTFPESMSQEQMYYQINADFQEKATSQLSRYK